MSKANKGALVIGALVTAIGLALYPVVVHPKLFPEKYRKHRIEKPQYKFVQCRPLFQCLFFIFRANAEGV